MILRIDFKSCTPLGIGEERPSANEGIPCKLKGSSRGHACPSAAMDFKSIFVPRVIHDGRRPLQKG